MPKSKHDENAEKIDRKRGGDYNPNKGLTLLLGRL